MDDQDQASGSFRLVNLQETGGIAADDAVIGHIAIHDRERTDNSILADSHVRQDHAAISNQRAFANLDEGVFIPQSRNNGFVVFRVVKGMRRIKNAAVGRNRNAIADIDSRLTNNMRVLLNAYVVSNAELWSSMREGVNRFQTRALTYYDTVPQMHELRIAQQQWRANHAAAAHAPKNPTIKQRRPDPGYGYGKLLELPVEREP